MAITFQSNLMFGGNTRRRRKHLKGASIGLALALPSNSKPWLERLSKDTSVMKENSFITLTPEHKMMKKVVFFKLGPFPTSNLIKKWKFYYLLLILSHICPSVMMPFPQCLLFLPLWSSPISIARTAHSTRGQRRRESVIKKALLTFCFGTWYISLSNRIWEVWELI